jgi:hypothetical protein
VTGPTKSVPFRVREVHGGLSEAAGLIYVEGDELVIELQMKFLSLFSRTPKVHRLDLVDLDTVRYKKGLRSDRLTLRTRPLDLLADIPGTSEGELCLLVKRAHRDDLTRLLDRLDLWRTD